MLSHRAPCHRFSTKSSSNAARAPYSQNTAGCADRIGNTHHHDDLGKNGASRDGVEDPSGGHGHAQQSMLTGRTTQQRHENDQQEHAARRTAEPKIDGREPHPVHTREPHSRAQLSHRLRACTTQTCGFGHCCGPRCKSMN
jgi:hypothetical protein